MLGGASTSETMKTKTVIALTLTICGALLLAAPMVVTFLLAVCNRTSSVNLDDRVTCNLGGGLLLLVGIVFDIFAFRAAGEPPKKGTDDTNAA